MGLAALDRPVRLNPGGKFALPFRKLAAGYNRAKTGRPFPPDARKPQGNNWAPDLVPRGVVHALGLEFRERSVTPARAPLVSGAWPGSIHAARRTFGPPAGSV